MPAVQYPFIDIAVHERVRDHFAAGEAVVLFAPDMRAAHWANGAGAELFGFGAIYDFLDQGPNRTDVAFRQTEAAARQLVTVGDTRSVTVRVTSGFQRVAIQAVCELIEVQGEAAVLFSAAVEKGRMSKPACAARMIEGFDDPETHMAVLDENAAVIAASGQFSRLQISPQTLSTLVNMANGDPSRLAKRPIPTVNGYLPAAVGKPSDDPALYLLFTVDTTQAHPAVDVEPVALQEPQPVEALAPSEEASATAPSSHEFAEAINALAEIEETPEEDEEISLFPEPISPTEGSDELPEPVEGADAPEPAAEISRLVEQDGSEAAQTAEQAPVETDMIVPAAAADADTSFVFQRDARAIRFVWKIDADGRFTEVSKEFAAAVGPHAADIIDMAFADLAALFHLDPEAKIVELLNKRDTWSGKTIWWPVEGTSLIVPVDLAALPTYTRTREFDGFRGFGIVRIADASEDPNAIGLGLTPSVQEDIVDDAAADISDEADILPDASEAEDTASVAQEEIADTPVLPTEPLVPDEALSEELHVPEAESRPSEQQTETAALPDVDDVQPEAPLPLEWPPGERPALRLVENAGRRYSDKVVQFEDRRSRLSPVEQAAFREIARQLDRFIGNENQPTSDVAAVEPMPTSAEPMPSDAEDETHAVTGHEDQAANEEIPTEVSNTEAEAEAEDVISAEPVEDGTAEFVGENTAPVSAQIEALDLPDQEPAAGVPALTETALSDRALLAQMIPIREKIGLSAEIVDQMPVALLVHNSEDLIHGNPEFLKLTGYASIEELAEIGGLDALLQRQDLEGKTSEASGMVVVRADDAIVPVTARLQSVRWGDATALMLALMPVAAEPAEQPEQGSEAQVIPLRPLRPADQLARLQVEVEELRAILETATDGVVIIDDKGDIRSMNRAASGLFNYDNEEINGKPFVVLFAHESQKAILDYLAGLSGHGVASVLNDGREVIGREASGGFLPLFMTIGRLTSSNGYCAVIRDITQWKRTEEELRTAKRAAETANAHKSDFLAHVSHEIRTPLNAIIGFSDMMAGERFGPIGHPRYIEYSNDIGRSGRHVLDIVNDLLDISKIEAGEMELDFIAVGLNETVSEAVSLVQPQANSQRVIIRTALSNAVPQVVADLRSIKQIVLNIVSNAIRFTPSGGQIVVSTAYEANGNVMLRVRDTGIGMTRSELELAMKPFRQVAGAARKRGDGTGLGLPLTKAMVDANRAVFAISSAPNEGTLVEITFPSQRVLAD
jgi:PAS domain S-box-containing protein